MIKANFRKAPAKKKPSSGIARSPSAKPTLCAHPRLVHGFLVRLAPRSIPPKGGEKRASLVVPSVKAQAAHPSDAKHEGPADDTTFH